MDNVIVELGRFGLAGLLVAVIVTFAHVLLKKQLAAAEQALQLARDQMVQREADIKWYRDQVQIVRDNSFIAMTEQQKRFLESQEMLRVTFQKTAEDMVIRLEGIDTVLKEMINQMKHRPPTA